jgi:urea transport system substrate-binding protein
MSVDSEANYDFIDKWHAYIGDEKRVTNDPMEAHYIGFNMWVKAVEKAGTTDVDAVREAMYGLTFRNLTGGTALMNTNHHLTKPVLIGEIQADGQFETVWQTPGGVIGDAWSNYLPESKVIVADWTSPISCGNYNLKSGVCSGQNY